MAPNPASARATAGCQALAVPAGRMSAVHDAGGQLLEQQRQVVVALSVAAKDMVRAVDRAAMSQAAAEVGIASIEP